MAIFNLFPKNQRNFKVVDADSYLSRKTMTKNYDVWYFFIKHQKCDKLFDDSMYIKKIKEVVEDYSKRIYFNKYLSLLLSI